MVSKDREPQSDLETRFAVLTSNLVAQMKNIQDSMEDPTGVVIRVVTNEWEDDGRQALMLNSGGNWSGRSYMMGWDIKNPSLEDLLVYYAEIKVPGFQALMPEERQAYVKENRERLSQGFITEMESSSTKLRELSTNQ